MSLRSLSDQQILSRIQSLTKQERSLTLQVLLHLNEIERRRLHLKLGYSSMFDYCTAGLGYSALMGSQWQLFCTTYAKELMEKNPAPAKKGPRNTSTRALITSG